MKPRELASFGQVPARCMILSLVNCNQYTRKKTNATFLFPALKVEKNRKEKQLEVAAGISFFFQIHKSCVQF
jgi:hypothetical protein